jgi:hypothetical protein
MQAEKSETEPMTLGQLVDYDYELREHIRVLNKKVDDLKEERDRVEAQLMEMMDAQNLPFVGGALARAAITETVVANVRDWDLFYGYVRRAKAFHLLERRVANAAYRELLATKTKVPGTEPFTKRSIALRTL